jgi:hypothetical protein
MDVRTKNKTKNFHSSESYVVKILPEDSAPVASGSSSVSESTSASVGSRLASPVSVLLAQLLQLRGLKHWAPRLTRGAHVR